MNGSEAGSGSPSGESSPGSGGSSRRPRGVVAAVVVLVSLLVIGVAVVIGLRLGGNYLGEQTSTGPFQTSTKATTTRASRKSRTATPTTTTARRTDQCDARTINTDLGYPGSGARIIDCGGGWAVMASEHSGDPYWVVYRNGRWQTRRDVSMYLMTCPDEAIAKGAPAWMANKHLDDCTASTAPTTRERETTRSRPRSTTPSPSVAPSPRPTPSVAPTMSPSSSPSPTSPTVPTETTEVTTTTTTHTGDAPADMEDTE